MVVGIFFILQIFFYRLMHFFFILQIMFIIRHSWALLSSLVVWKNSAATSGFRAFEEYTHCVKTLLRIKKFLYLLGLTQ